jgi:hypothetical protein
LRIEIMSLRNILVLLAGGLLLVGSIVSSAHAQGSAGGSIGNDDKSVSGSRSAPRSVEPDRPSTSRRSKPAAEEPRRAARTGSGGGNYDGTWSYVGVGTTCQGTGAGSFTVSGGRVSLAGGSGSVSPSGSITSTSVGADGVRITASGRLSGSSGGGRYTRADGCAGNWTATRN